MKKFYQFLCEDIRDYEPNGWVPAHEGHTIANLPSNSPYVGLKKIHENETHAIYHSKRINHWSAIPNDFRHSFMRVNKQTGKITGEIFADIHSNDIRIINAHSREKGFYKHFVPAMVDELGYNVKSDVIQSKDAQNAWKSLIHSGREATLEPSRMPFKEQQVKINSENLDQHSSAIWNGKENNVLAFYTQHEKPKIRF